MLEVGLLKVFHGLNENVTKYVHLYVLASNWDLLPEGMRGDVVQRIYVFLF